MRKRYHKCDQNVESVFVIKETVLNDFVVSVFDDFVVREKERMILVCEKERRTLCDIMMDRRNI